MRRWISWTEERVRELMTERVRGKKRGGENGEECTRWRERDAKGAERRVRGGPPRRVAAFASTRGQRSSTFAPECPW